MAYNSTDCNHTTRNDNHCVEVLPKIDEISPNNSKTKPRNKRLILNVSGMKFETYEETLGQYPNTLLGCTSKRELYYDTESREYFFDRNRSSFEAILYFYQSNGKLVRPNGVPFQVFADEVRFFELGKDYLQRLQEEEGYLEEKTPVMPRNEYQKKVWELFEFPDSSQAARYLALWSVLIILLSIVVFCLETLPSIRCRTNPKGTNCNSTLKGKKIDMKGERLLWLEVIEAICMSWFTLEYLVRLFSSPQKLLFLRSFLNLIDLVAILPYFITLPMEEKSRATSLAVLRVIRLVRVFRIFKLSRHSKGLQVLGQTLKSSSRELGMLMFFLIMGVVLFSSAVYYAEQDEEKTKFTSIPVAFWWAVVTMTTVLFLYFLLN